MVYIYKHITHTSHTSYIRHVCTTYKTHACIKQMCYISSNPVDQKNEKKKKRIKIFILKMTGKLKKRCNRKIRSKKLESERFSVMSDSLQPHRRYVSPWNSPGQNTGEDSLFLLQGIFPNQESNQGLLDCRQILYQLSYQGSPPHPQKSWKTSPKIALIIRNLKRLN